MRKMYALALVAGLAAGPALADPVTLADRDMDQVVAGGLLQDLLNALFPTPTPVTPPTTTVTDKKTDASGNSTASSTSSTTVPAGSNATTTRSSFAQALPGFSTGTTFSSITFP